MRFDYHSHPDVGDPGRVQIVTDLGEVLDEGVQIKSLEGIELLIYGFKAQPREPFAEYARILPVEALVIVPYVFLKSDRKKIAIKDGWRDDYILGDIPQRPHSLLLSCSVSKRQTLATRMGLDMEQSVCELFGSDALLPFQSKAYTEIQYDLPYSRGAFKAALRREVLTYHGFYYPSWQCFLISVILKLRSLSG